MMNLIARCFSWSLIVVMMSAASAAAAGGGEKDSGLRLSWKKNFLTIHGEHLPGKSVKVMYLEAYCRPGSTDREWGKTTIGHKTELLEADKDGQWLKLKCVLADGVTVTHEIRTEPGAIDFRLVAHNPTDKTSLAHWAQPCVRVDQFTGLTQKTYLPKAFVFLKGKPVRLPTPVWATKARYVPGQVWAPRNVNRNDVNPRPLSPQVPSNGLIGCYSGDNRMILASAWEPYQELFQGVITCVHSDFRIGGLKPGETKKIRGKLYLVDADMNALMDRYRKDFPEHSPTKSK